MDICFGGENKPKADIDQAAAAAQLPTRWEGV